MQWVFDTLGISHDADARTVRKAYARAIKACDPATEAERFQRIRQAYEWALQWTERREAAAAQHVVTVEEATDEAPHETPEPESGAAPAPRAPPLLGIVRPTLRPAPNEAERLSGEVLEDLKRALAAHEPPSPATILDTFAQDVRLTSLDAKSQFELRLLILCYSAPLNIPLLDAACAAFAWETSNRHLAQARPDLVQRMLRQQTLLRLLAERRELGTLVDAAKFHARVQLRPSEPRPWQLDNVGQIIQRYEGFRRELDERYGAPVMAWWREQYAAQPGKGASLADSLAHLPPPSRARAAKKAPRSGATPIFAIVVAVILLNLLSHLGQSSPPMVSARVEQTAPPPVNLGVLTQQASQRSQGMKPFYQLGHDAPPSPARTPSQADQAAGRHDFQMATAYERGDGVPQNDVRATEFYEQSAKEGYGPAQFELGQRFHDGRNEARDEFMARHWWEKAAEQGNVSAQFELGDMLARTGKHKDYDAASHWWQMAAMRGDPRAEEGMGWLCLNGFGVPHNDRVAYYWLRKASGKGNALALTELAAMYEQGTAPVHSGRIAYALMTLVAAKDYALRISNEQNMAKLRASLSRAQLDSAMMLAEELRPRDTFEARLLKAEGGEIAPPSS